MKTLPDTHVREVSCCPSPFISAYQENLQYENITRHACTGGIVLPVSSHHLADTAHPVTGPAFPDFLIDIE